MNFDKKTFTTKIAGRDLILETSRLAEQASAAVVAHYGETAVLATVVANKEERDVDFLPLTVDYEEKFYAVGKILGSRFMRREGKSSDEAVLSGRLIDRVIRPLFDHGIRRDLQVIITVLAMDGENDPDFVALMATSMALAISEIPWDGPAAGVRIAKIEKDFVINPVNSQLTGGFVFDSFVAGPKDKINMIELEGVEAQEKDVEEAFALAQKEIKKLVDFQNDVVKQVGKPKIVEMISFNPRKNEELFNKVNTFLKGKLEPAMFVSERGKNYENLAVVRGDLMEVLKADDYTGKDLAAANHILESLLDELVHEKAIKEGKRPDGRALDEVRELGSEVGLFKRNHGSAWFIRGGTQSLAITTLASPEGAQMIESVEFSGKKRFMLHYNFPPYSTGETGRMRGPGRREIGHGALAEKAVRNVIPPKDKFPYAIRVVSEIVASNGSSSMASVCAATLSLMDAGVPIKKPVAGIAMGLMDGGKDGYKILTDIQGPEDHHGDMDFKVAGTRDGVSAIQLDVKNHGLTMPMVKETMTQAKKARIEILDHIEKTIKQPRAKISEYAPKILSLKIDPEKIGAVVGSGGKTINGIVERTGVAAVDIDDDGQVYISADDSEKAEAAKSEVESIVKEYKVGDIVEGTIVKIMDFGAIVELGPHQDGMVHVSELKDGFVKNVRDVVKEGDFVRAKVIKVEHGKIGLSLKGLKG